MCRNVSVITSTDEHEFTFPSIAMGKTILSKIFSRFWKEYSNYIKTFQGNVKHFQGFTDIIESLDLTLTI